MKLSQMVAVVPGSTRVVGDAEMEITSLCTDSRKAQRGALFFCIPGTRMNAHDFAPQAVAGGASALVVDHTLPLDVAQVVVSDVREALSYMAAAFYGHPAKRLKLIGITGTKGKTTVSFLIKSILEQAGYTVGLIGTVGSMIGDMQLPSNLTTPDPIDFQQLLRRMADMGAQYVVMEVSAHAIAMKRIAGMRFEVAGFTNLSQDHLDFFGDMAHYLDTKVSLFTEDQCACAVYNADDEAVARRMRALPIETRDIGIRVASDIHANDIEVTEHGCVYKLTCRKCFREEIHLQLSGIFNVYNSMMAAAMADVAGVSPQAIKLGLEAVRNVPGRIELLETETPYRVILDYAHSPDALENILTTVKQTAKHRVIALFGCGGDRDHEKRPMMGEIGGRLADYCILTSDNPRSEDPNVILAEIERGIEPTHGQYVVIENRREAIRTALTMAEPGDVVVLAGKGHETYQEIKGVKHPFDEKVVVKELLEEIAGDA